MNLYNEIDPFACAWLERLIDGNHIAPGRVTDRSIEKLTAAELGDGQCHFFAGIGVWSAALRLAGVADDAPIWTGSCPCQPFSRAGLGAGVEDVRHLWPAWFRLIDERRPAIVFGEQVASGPGLAWLDAVFADMERAGYSCGASDLPAAGVGAPHIRQRLYFVAYAPGQRREGIGLQPRRRRSGSEVSQASRGGEARRLGDTGSHGTREHDRELPRDESQHGQRAAHGDHAPVDPSAARDPWSDAEWIPCSDGVSRPVEPGTFPLAHGPATRVGQLRAYGNAIVRQLAATFVVSALDAIAEVR